MKNVAFGYIAFVLESHQPLQPKLTFSSIVVTVFKGSQHKAEHSLTILIINQLLLYSLSETHYAVKDILVHRSVT